LLTIPAAAAAARLAARDGDRTDRMGAKPDDYHARLAARFAELAVEAPERWRVVDASPPVEDVTAALIAALADLVP
jgi:dTMP kinase